MYSEFIYNTEILSKTEELVNNRNFLKVLLEDNRNIVETTIRRRLVKWLNYFNQKYYQNHFIYSNTVYALFDACNTNALFISQTEHEFIQSLKFYDRIIECSYLLKPINFVISKHLLGLSLIYGRYGSMQTKSFKVALEYLKYEISENNLHEFFKSLFIKRDYPKPFPKNITQFEPDDLHLLMAYVNTKPSSNRLIFNYQIDTQAKAIQYFFEKIDIEMIDIILLDNYKYMEVDKHVFIRQLAIIFNQFIESGDTFLFPFEGACNGCSKGKFGFSFVGNLSYNYINIIFEISDGYVIDLYECSNFKARIGDLKLNQRFSIDFNYDNIF